MTGGSDVLHVASTQSNGDGIVHLTQVNGAWVEEPLSAGEGERDGRDRHGRHLDVVRALVDLKIVAGSSAQNSRSRFDGDT